MSALNPEDASTDTAPAHRTLPTLRSVSDSLSSTSPSSTPLGIVNAARRPLAGATNSSPSGHTSFASMSSMKSGGLPADVQARLQAFQASRKAPPMNGVSPTSGHGGMPPIGPVGSPPGGGMMGMCPGGLPGGMSGRMAMGQRPSPSNWNSAPAIAGRMGHVAPKPSLGQRRGLKLPGGLPGNPPTATGGGPMSLGGNTPTRSNGASSGSSGASSGGSAAVPGGDGVQGSMFTKYANFVDTKTGSLKFAGKAVIHSKGVDFSSGSSFNISLDEIDTMEELGKGNYGTVYKVIHRRPSPNRRIGGASLPGRIPSPSNLSPDENGSPSTPGPTPITTGTGVEMAMKEIRLELDENKFAQIIMELDVLHRCVSPCIIDFYGAFFQEGAVYICMEYMDGGSIDKLYRDGVPEGVLRKITLSTVRGLKTLKDDHNIIHRDVKPTNILVNTRGEVKLCDFGVSGNLVASIAKTNIGCQSYMAPERIASGGIQAAIGGVAPGTYSVQSDIWSLGLSILECAMGCYPYPPETYNNIFSQLSAIVDGVPPDLPEAGFSPQARDFVRGCLNKIPNLRPTYAVLLQHPWLSGLMYPPVISEEAEDDDGTATPPTPASPVRDGADKEVGDWVADALAKRKARIEEGGKGPESGKPALHAAPLDTVVSPGSDKVVDEAAEGFKKLNV